TTKPTPAPAPRPTPAPTTAPAPAPDKDGPGVPAGTRLTKMNGDLTITKAGTVISNAEIYGRVSIRAANVTIKNSRIRAQHPSSVGVVNTKAAGVVIKDSEILSDHRNPTTNGVMGSNFTLERVRIRSVVDQVHIHGAGNVTIRDSWLHDNTHYEQDPNWGGKPSHDDNIQVTSGSDIRIENTRLEDAHNAAVMLAQDQGTIADVTLRGNTIGGGACSVNVAQKSRGPLAGLTIAQNAFIRGTQRLDGCAVIAPLTYKSTLSGNVWEQTGSAVTLTRG
ncbi:right-handed parallel beta-helix repeat-containing protein, partial [Aeromicrobium sp.]|uniref:right-handed parallel beta-helix repeat-containing protein n=1 Tax=Aeromicrobium sp. TaxID=1871063 RepID=UPI0028B22D30